MSGSPRVEKEHWTIEAGGPDQENLIYTRVKSGTQRLLSQRSGRKRPGHSTRLGSSPSMDFSNINCSSREAGGSCSHAGMPLGGPGGRKGPMGKI